MPAAVLQKTCLDGCRTAKMILKSTVSSLGYADERLYLPEGFS
jgi:hypothetical protein